MRLYKVEVFENGKWTTAIRHGVPLSNYGRKKAEKKAAQIAGENPRTNYRVSAHEGG